MGQAKRKSVHVSDSVARDNANVYADEYQAKGEWTSPLVLPIL